MSTTVDVAGGTANTDVLSHGQKVIPYSKGPKDVQQAAWTIGRTFPGGYGVLAERLEMDADVIKKKLNPNCLTHKLSIAEAVDVQVLANRFDILYAMAWSTDHVCIHVPEAEAKDIGLRLVAVGSQVGDVFRVAQRVLEDGEIDATERQELMGHVIEAISALAQVLKAA